MCSYCEALRIFCAVATATSESRPSALSMLNFVFSGATLKDWGHVIRGPYEHVLFTFALCCEPSPLSPPSLARSLSRSTRWRRARKGVATHTPRVATVSTPHPCFRHCLFFTMDARDILESMHRRGVLPQGRAHRPSIKKPEGMSREVFVLLLQDIKEGA